MTNDKPKERADVCLGWFCDYRDKCTKHIEQHGTVITRYFLPIHKGEHCEYYTEAELSSGYPPNQLPPRSDEKSI